MYNCTVAHLVEEKEINIKWNIRDGTAEMEHLSQSNCPGTKGVEKAHFRKRSI